MNSIKPFILQKLKQDVSSEIYDSFKDVLHINNIQSLIDDSIDEYFQDYQFNEDNISDDCNQDSNHLYRDRDLYDINESNCYARIWNEGYGGQCSRKCHPDSKHHLCLKHDKKYTNHTLSLGLIHERRPEDLKSSNGTSLHWK